MTLALGFEHVGGRTLLRVHRQDPPLQVVRAFAGADGGTLVHLHNVSGGILGGDDLHTQIRVEAGATVQLTSTGATRVYRNQHGARQRLDVHVAAHGLLEYLPDPLIPFAGSRYRQETCIELSEGAGLFWWETVAPGRTASGELFQYDCLDLSVELRADGRPVYIEHVSLQDGALLAPYRYFATFLACQAGLPEARWLELEGLLEPVCRQRTAIGTAVWGVSTLAADGIVVRCLAVPGRVIPGGLMEVWSVAKRYLHGRHPIPPRKIY